jgi:UDP-N-acetyl-D-glucosamine dehydrogenase
MQRLQEQGAILSYNDPHIPQLPSMRHYDVPDLVSQPLVPSWLAEQDAIVIVTDHSAYDWDLVVRHAKLVVDTRNATQNVAHGREKIRRA